MKYAGSIAAILLLGLITGPGANPALAQTGAMPDMTPEQAQAMAEQMMLRLGGQIGLDPEALRNATPEQRKEMMRGAADTMAGQTMQQMEQAFGMPAEELKNLSKEEMRTLMVARLQPPAMAPPLQPRPLRSAPPRGFPDGSVALPVAADYSAELAVAEPAGRELLLVAVDLPARRIVWRETLTTPFERHLDLLDIAPDPSVLILELIDPATRRVIRRYRPVAAAGE
jgi:hypothetical protein